MRASLRCLWSRSLAAQDKFGVEISDKQIKSLAAVEDVANFVSKSS
jgi:acyl carrier protein